MEDQSGVEGGRLHNKAFVDAKGLPSMSRIAKDEARSLAEKSGSTLPPEILTPAFDIPATFTETIQPKDSANYSGKVFLLVDDYVFSSAESFSDFCKGSGLERQRGIPHHARRPGEDVA